MFIISMCYSNVFVAMFTNNTMTMPIADRAIKIFCLGILMMSIQYVLVDGITGLSNVKLSLFLSLNRKMMYLCCTCLLPAFLGVSNIFYAQPIADIYASIVTIICFIKNHTFLFKKPWSEVRRDELTSRFLNSTVFF